MSKRRRKQTQRKDDRPLWERLRDEYIEKTKAREQKNERNHSKQYFEYLRSADWQWVKTVRNYTIAHNKCEICGATRLLEGHHLWYPHDLYQTTPETIQMICKPCHKEADRKRREARQNEKTRQT